MTAKAVTSLRASLIVWDLETVLDIGGFAAAGLTFSVSA
jgi:hypothetical protein